MIDIVERCRENKCKENMGCNTSPTCSCADLEDAADTIDQLRAELDAATTYGLFQANNCDVLQSQLKKIEAELAALRENNNDN
jgi:hypothetical protein